MICWLAALLGVALAGCAAPTPQSCDEAQKALFDADWSQANLPGWLAPSEADIEAKRAEVARLCG